MLEKEIERRLGSEVRKRGGLYYKFVSPGNPGVPDRIIITPWGRVVFVELKTDKGRLSARQIWQRERLQRCGAEVRVVKGWGAAQTLLEEVMPDGI